MGYSEILCHICGVSFNIQRLRTQDEPREAAWTHFLPSFVNGNGNSCMPDSGCKIVRRRRRSPAPPPPSGQPPWDFSSSYLEPSDDEDFDYEVESSVDDPLEYDSSHGDDEENLAAQDLNILGGSQTNDRDAQDYRRFCDRTVFDVLKVTKNHLAVNDKFEDMYIEADEETRGKTSNELIPSHLVNRCQRPGDPIEVPRWLYRYPEADTWTDGDIVSEHVAGPGCACEQGYSGHRVSAMEMKTCLTLQCLVQKNEFWQPEPDDEEFEARGRFFLSGISDYMQSRDMGLPSVFPARHRTSSPYAENNCWQPEIAHEMAMPFHPHCFEVWKRASLLRQGDIDVEGLTGWWINEMEYTAFNSFPRHPAVSSARDQWWRHNPGDEFLVTNPLFLLGLPEILKSSVRSAPDFNVRNSPFAGEITIMQNGSDPFDSIPEELWEMVLSHLESKDIANLRLASPTFRHLPMSLWYELLQKEMPWLWEAWSDLPYCFWSTTTKRELEPHLKCIEARKEALDEYFAELEDDMPETKEQNVALKELQYGELEREAAEARKSVKPIRLQWANTDWHHLYLQITRNWKSLKGLQNRERIWTDCEEILRRVASYRSRGMIPVEDVRATVQALDDAANEKRRKLREEEERNMQAE